MMLMLLRCMDLWGEFDWEGVCLFSGRMGRGWWNSSGRHGEMMLLRELRGEFDWEGMCLFSGRMRKWWWNSATSCRGVGGYGQ